MFGKLIIKKDILSIFDRYIQSYLLKEIGKKPSPCSILISQRFGKGIDEIARETGLAFQGSVLKGILSRPRKELMLTSVLRMLVVISDASGIVSAVFFHKTVISGQPW
jgi:hypothetical protein